jgi:hypothetical protein
MEKWHYIKGYEDSYMVSDFGRVKSLDRTINGRCFKGKILKPILYKNGYYFVTLWRRSKADNRTIHRLVLESFIENTENKMDVNHIDCNKLNNYLSNLEWATRSENELHAYKNNLKKGAWFGIYGEKHPQSKLYKHLP